VATRKAVLAAKADGTVCYRISRSAKAGAPLLFKEL
jgi:hypothetical protein